MGSRILDSSCYHVCLRSQTDLKKSTVFNATLKLKTISSIIIALIVQYSQLLQVYANIG